MGKKRGAANASKSLTLEQLSGYFHMPINEVAKELSICVTVLKQRCREFGITRWPYRKVRKLDAIINALESGGQDSDAAATLSGGAAAAGVASGVTAVEVTERLATVKQTRELLLQNPNSTAHLQLGKVKTVRKAPPPADGDRDGSQSGERPSRPRRAAPAAAPAPAQAAPLAMMPPMPHGMMPPGMEGGASIEDAQRSAMLAYAAYSSASAFSNAAAMYMAGGGVAALPRGGSGTSLDGSGPIRPIATSGSFSNALAATAAGACPEGAPAAALAAAPAGADSAEAVPAEAGAPPPASALNRIPSPPSRAAEGAELNAAGAPALPHNPPGGHLFFPVGGLTMPPMGHLPMPHMMPMPHMVGPMGMFYGSGYPNMPMHLAAHGMAGMPIMAWPPQPPPPQPR